MKEELSEQMQERIEPDKLDLPTKLILIILVSLMILLVIGLAVMGVKG